PAGPWLALPFVQEVWKSSGALRWPRRVRPAGPAATALVVVFGVAALRRRAVELVLQQGVSADVVVVRRAACVVLAGIWRRCFLVVARLVGAHGRHSMPDRRRRCCRLADAPPVNWTGCRRSPRARP